MSILTRLRTKQDPVVLHAFLGDEAILTLHARERFDGKPFFGRVRPGKTVLRFVDRGNLEHRFDLAFALKKKKDCLHFGVCVTDQEGVQADFLLTDTSDEPGGDFRARGIEGVRLQRFFLAESKFSDDQVAGKTLMSRGFHFQGRVSSGNLSYLCICDYCRKNFRMRAYHSGFSNVVFFYCDSGSHLLTCDNRIPAVAAVLREADLRYMPALEEKLPKCKVCGGSFHYLNPIRCPHCRKPYVDYRRFPEERNVDYYCYYIRKQDVQSWDPTKS